MNWRIYYAGGATYSSEDGLPENAPAMGVLVIVQPDPDVGRVLITMCDHYWYTEGEWRSGDWFGWMDYLIQPGTKIVKFGRTVSNREFADTHERAQTDLDFPRKMGFLKSEKRLK